MTGIAFGKALTAGRNVAVGTPAMLDTLKTGRNVFLSPHYDDIAFSLGMLATTIGHGTLINLFTRSLNLPNAEIAASGDWDVASISALRDDEDARFADAAGLDRLKLDLEEPPLRGRHPKDLAGLEEDMGQLRAPLLDTLNAIAANTSAPINLFCPGAIGRHINHYATMRVVTDFMPRLGERYRVLFYEDLPYSSSFRRRALGLGRLSERVPGRLERHYLDVGASLPDKLAMVAAYHSQHRRPPRPHRYWPQTYRLPAHEAFWSIAGI